MLKQYGASTHRSTVIQRNVPSQTISGGRNTTPEHSAIERIIDSIADRQVGRTVAREITRGLLGALDVRKR